MKKMAVKILGAALLLAALFLPNIIASGKDKETSQTTLTSPTQSCYKTEVAEGKWKTLTPPLRDCDQTEVVDGKIYIIGRVPKKSYSVYDTIKYDMEVYNPSTDTWTSVASLPVICHPFSTEVVNGKIYAIAQYMHNNDAVDIEVYDPSTDTWSALPPMPIAQLTFRTEVVDGKLYVIGSGNGTVIGTTAGADGKSYYIGDENNEVIGATEVYDPSTGAWTTLSCMPKYCANCSGIFQTEVDNGKIYVMGISNIDEKPFFEVYDPSADAWTILSSIPTTFSRFILQTKTEVVDGKIYAMGYDIDCNFDFDDAYKSDEKVITLSEVYDPSTDTWKTLSSMPTARFGFNTEVIDGKIYVMGGADDADSNFKRLTSTEVYDPSTDTWTTMNSMSGENTVVKTEVIDRTIYSLNWNAMEAYTVNANDKNKQK